jgi:gamma-glutamyltranspeptidase/glutathione hydrolase
MFMPHGRAPLVGERVCMPGAAATLKALARRGARDYYEGETAEKLVAYLRGHGAAMTLQDFAGFTPEWCGTISRRYRGHELHEIPPNGQGIAALMALGMLAHFDLAALPLDGAASFHLQIEAMKLAFADVYRFVADPTAMQVTVAQLLDPGYLAQRARLIDPHRAQAPQAGSPADPHRQGGTIYLTAADEAGMMVSFIQSNYMGFGSGCVEPTFGISLQNRGHGFGLPASPLNPANLVGPGKRPFHTIIPAFLTRPVPGQPTQLEPVMSFGVMGANMQPQGHLQTLVRLLDHGQSLQAACDAPRWRVTTGLAVQVEAAMNPHTVSGLRALGHEVEVVADSYQDFGAGQFIWRLGDPGTQGYVAASDPRRDGLVAGW